MTQEIPYAGWKRNLRLQGTTTELVITLDVELRIIRYAFPGDKNVFVELPEQMGGSGETEWMIRGGHRLWTRAGGRALVRAGQRAGDVEENFQTA